MSSPTTSIEKIHVTRTPGVCGGKPCIAGTRIRVQDIVILTEGGASPDEIIVSYPHITLADVYGALAYYHDHREEIEQQIRDSEAFVQEMRKLGPGPLEERELRERAMLRFHLDENVDFAIAHGLRSRGFDVTTTPPDMPKKATDQEQIDFALSQLRVLITHDDDMLAMSRRGVRHAGIAFNPLCSKTIGQLILRLALLSRQFTPEEMIGRVEFI